MSDLTEWEKMISGKLYDASDPDLTARRRRAQQILQQFNNSREEESDRREALLNQLFGKKGVELNIQPPFYCDYGSNITLGERVFFNFNCVVLDVAPVTIGSDVLIGPAVQIYTATHPLDYQTRRQWLEYALPISIGSDVWIGGGAILLPGVTIGDRSVIGAGSVVTKDVPPDVFAAGNPCRVIRGLGENRKPEEPRNLKPKK